MPQPASDRPPRMFLDTSVLLAAAWSPSGGSSVLLQLGEQQLVHLLASREVVSELDSVLRRKTPDLLAWAAALADRTHLEVVDPADASTGAIVAELVSHPGDAAIAAAALTCHPDYFVTLDKQHLLGNQALVEHCPFLIGTPGDALAWFRERAGL